MTGKARNSQAAQDLQCIVDAAQAHAQSNPHQFEETITPDHSAGTNSKGAHRYPYFQTNQRTPHGNHHQI
jgi:hypothetical protein